MKKIIYTFTIVVALVIAASCSSSKKTTSTNVDTAQNDTIRIANDSLEYEVIIIEPGFNAWLATQPQRGFYSQSAMEITNYFKVTQYNLRTRQPLQFDRNLYPYPIDYKKGVDYGYEVNYLLFNYFKYFEQRYNQRLR